MGIDMIAPGHPQWNCQTPLLSSGREQSADWRLQPIVAASLRGNSPATPRDMARVAEAPARRISQLCGEEANSLKPDMQNTIN
jgi:hypothetical protein